MGDTELCLSLSPYLLPVVLGRHDGGGVDLVLDEDPGRGHALDQRRLEAERQEASG